jgi:hypothetical protein
MEKPRGLSKAILKENLSVLEHFKEVPWRWLSNKAMGLKVNIEFKDRPKVLTAEAPKNGIPLRPPLKEPEGYQYAIAA